MNFVLFFLARPFTCRRVDRKNIYWEGDVPMHWRMFHPRRKVLLVAWCLLLLLVKRMFGSRVSFGGLLAWPQRRLAELS